MTQSQYPGWIWTDRGWQPDPAYAEWHEQQAAEARRRKEHPHPEPVTYPQLLRTHTWAWWKPLVGILAGVMLLFVAQALLLVLLVAQVLTEHGPGTFGDRFEKVSKLTPVTPWTMLYTNLGLASLVLIAWFAVRVVHGLGFRWLVSVRPGVRWRFFWACLGAGVVALLVSLFVGALLPGDVNDLHGHAAFPHGQLLATGFVILFTTPLQAMGEEFGFRGYLMQAFGSMTDAIARRFNASPETARRWAQGVALLLTSTLFALAHGTQNFPLFFDRFAFGLIAGLVVIIVGGLEAGIALHILNNLLAFGFAVAFNQVDSTLTVSSTSWWQLPVTVVQNGLFLVLVLWIARRMGLRNTTDSEAPPRLVGQQAFV